MSYAYLRPSTLTSESGLMIQTCGGRAERSGFVGFPRLFAGFLTDPVPAANALAVLADIARREAPADPIVTSADGILRFEAYGRVHARLDLLPSALSGQFVDNGTTHVDLGRTVRKELASLDQDGRLRLEIGPDRLAVSTTEDPPVSREVVLPPAWLRGFADVSARTAGAVPRLDVAAGRLMDCPPDLEPVLRFASRVRAFGVDGVHTWVAESATFRFTVSLPADGPGHPDPELIDLAIDDAAHVGELLGWDTTVDEAELVAVSGLSPQRLRDALRQLAVAGRVGYDVAEAGYFPRILPYPGRAGILDPRRTAAYRLAAAGRVVRGRDTAAVGPYVVRLVGGVALSCECPWWTNVADRRGSCRHMLAVDLDGTVDA